ncbi:MAG: HlyD family type I secretion periplasmic adaptor subunit [Rhodospirillaceae bacterium]
MLKLLAPPLKNLTDRARELRRRALDQAGLLIESPAVLPDAIAYQEPVDEIAEELPPKAMRSIHYIMVGMFLLTLFLAAIIKVDIVVVGTGRLLTEAPPIVMQPMDRTILRELKVRPGDTVKKGQLLATLDPTFAQADLGALTAQQRTLVAQVRRLEAELNGQPFTASGNFTQEDQLQLTLYNQRQSQYAAQLKVYDEEVSRREANIRTTEDQRESQAKQLVIAKEVESMRSQMFAKEVGSRLNFLNAQSARMQIEQAVQDAANRLTEQKHDLQSKRAERQAYVDGWRQKILEDLVTARTSAEQVGEGISKAGLLNDLVTVTAPDDGVIVDIPKRSVGSIMREGEPLITIVPSNSKMIGEIMVNSKDVGYAKPGDHVVIKVDSFSYQRHGMLEGKLVSVSEESYIGGAVSNSNAVVPPATSDASGAFHKGFVELTKTELEDLPEGARLIPGMTMSAEIKVGSRSVLGYFLNPITRGLSESIREP